MAKGLKIDWKQSSMIAAIVTLASLLVNYVFSTLLNQTVKPLFTSVPAVTPITGTLGDKVLAFVGGIIPLTQIPGLGYIAIFISALAVVIAGELIIDNLKVPYPKKLPLLKGRVARLASVIVYGAIPVYLILIGFALPDVMTTVGVLIYTVLVSVVAVSIANLMKLKV